MQDYDKPSILESPVDKLILYSFNVNDTSIENLGLLDCPDEDSIKAAKIQLKDLGMIEMNEKDGNVALSADGKIASRLSMIEPQDQI